MPVESVDPYRPPATNPYRAPAVVVNDPAATWVGQPSVCMRCELEFVVVDRYKRFECARCAPWLAVRRAGSLLGICTLMIAGTLLLLLLPLLLLAVVA